MKAVILAGGQGTRMGEETVLRPKPLVEIGGRPIIWHILKLYQFYGISDFIVCAGYAGQMMADHFAREAIRTGGCRWWTPGSTPRPAAG